MSTLVAQRCFHHLSREAVARCPQCGHCYCRECITEHDHRVICATCLKQLAAAAAKPPRRRANFWPALQLAAGLLVAWILFYSIGLRLVALPAAFHDDALWQSTFTSGFKAPPADE